MTITVHLLVTGILSLFVCFFQMASFVAARMLYRLVRAGNRELKSKPFLLYDADDDEDGMNELAGENTKKNRFWSKMSLKNAVRFYITHSRNRKDRLIIFWSVAMGLQHIFVDGTFAVLSNGMRADKLKEIWLFSLWRSLGHGDGRFINGDRLYDFFLHLSLILMGLFPSHVSVTCLRIPRSMH